MKGMTGLRSLLLLPLVVTTVARAESFNLRTNPIGWVVGPNARLDYKVDTMWSAGLTTAFVDRTIKAVDMNGYSAGLMLTYNHSETFTAGWYAEAGGGYGDYRAQATDSVGALDKTQVHNTF